MADCIFCRIIDKTIPSSIIYEDEQLLAFHDINPQAPVHFLVIPKEHIPSANHITPENSTVIARIFEKIPQLAKELGAESYRVVNNCGELAGQSVGHIHFHVLGNRSLAWPPG